MATRDGRAGLARPRHPVGFPVYTGSHEIGGLGVQIKVSFGAAAHQAIDRMERLQPWPDRRARRTLRDAGPTTSCCLHTARRSQPERTISLVAAPTTHKWE